MKKFALKLSAAALCFLATANLAAAASSGHKETRQLDPVLLKTVGQALLERQQVEIEKRYPAMLFKPEMMNKMMGELALQTSMQNAVQPVIMNMVMGILTNNGQGQQDAVSNFANLREQIVKTQQEAMMNMHAQAPMQSQMREKMVNAIAPTGYLQDIFMPRQKAMTQGEFHAGFFLQEQMKTNPVPLPGIEPVPPQYPPKK